MKRLGHVLALTAALLGVVTSSAVAKDIVVDDDGAATSVATPKGTCGAPNYNTIQAAVDAAADGDRIFVCKGTYEEQVDVNNKKVALYGIDKPVIRPPGATDTQPGMVLPPGSLVRFRGANTNSRIEGFEISGPVAATGCATRFTGVLVHEGASATVTKNLIKNIRLADDALLGCQTGQGVQVGSFDSGTGLSFPGTAHVSHNVIDDYQKTGVIVNEEGSKGYVRENVISGFGPSDDIAQNGIQFGFNSDGEALKNLVKDNVYTGPANDASTGILLIDLDPSVKVAANAVVKNQYGVGGWAVDGASIELNLVHENLLDGISLDSELSFFPPFGIQPSTNNKIQFNFVHDNDGNGIRIASGSTQNTIKYNAAFSNGDNTDEYDCRDENENTTSNTWRDNVAGTSNPAGLCKTQFGGSHHHGDGKSHTDAHALPLKQGLSLTHLLDVKAAR